MNGKSEDDILKERESLIDLAKRILVNEDVEVIDSYLDLGPDAQPLEYLAESIRLMASADYVVFSKGWANYRGCKVEHLAAEGYGLGIIE